MLNEIVKIEVNIVPPKPKVNLILLENSKVTSEKLITLFESFNSQSPKSFTFIFDFSKKVEDVVDFRDITEIVNSTNPPWGDYVIRPFWLGNIIATTITSKLDLCMDVCSICFGEPQCQVEYVWYYTEEQLVNIQANQIVGLTD